MTTADKTLAEIEKWLDENWDPEITVAQWWEKLGGAGLANPTLAEPWGRGWSR